MKLPRPYIPLEIRFQVAYRQLTEKLGLTFVKTTGSRSRDITTCLRALFGDAKVHLDHDPPLCNRTPIKDPVTGEHKEYHPAANDPDYLIYRKADDHKTKTFVRGDGALRSDMAQRRYLKRVAAHRKPKRKFKPRRAKHIRRLPHAPVTS